MENKKIAKIFDQIGDILEIQGSNVFRIRSYRRAAQIVEGFPHDMRDIVEKRPEELKEIKGIGKDLSQKIIEIVETGECAMHQDLLKTFNPDLLEMLEIRGVGPKKVRLFMLNLGIETIDALKKAAEAGKIQELDGMGAKSEAEILKAIEEKAQFSGRILLHDALETAEHYIDYMKKSKALDKIEYAGSLRRSRETIGDIDLLCSGSDHAQLMDHFIAYDRVKTVIAQGDTKSSVILDSGVQVDLRVLAHESLGAALHYFTGSKRHNILIRNRAKKMGLKVNEYGVFKGEKSIAGATEEELFKAVGLPYIEPELREDRGEIDAAEKGKLPHLISTKDLKGDLHLHSTWSDGSDSIEALAHFYKEQGFKYIAVTDHSPSLAIAKGLDVDRVLEKIKEVKEVNKNIKDFTVLMGTEVDILKDGSLDYPDEILEQLDIVVASIHMGFSASITEQTDRIIKAMSNPHVHILGHAHGRLLGKREGYEIDMEGVIEAALSHKVAIEINSQPMRLDVFDYNCMLIKEKGAKVVINSDAHHHSQAGYLKFGVSVARRGWLEKKDVLNTRPLNELLSFWE